MESQTLKQQHKKLVNELNSCAAECDHCFSACLKEKDVQMLAKCIELDRNCSDVCRMTAAFIGRDTDIGHSLLRTCVEACDACAAECAKHEHEHCRKCAEACRQCAVICRQHYE